MYQLLQTFNCQGATVGDLVALERRLVALRSEIPEGARPVLGTLVATALELQDRIRRDPRRPTEARS